eukprot:972242_1
MVHMRIFGVCLFDGSGDKGHCRAYSISTSSHDDGNKINENAAPYPICPLLPRIQLKRYSSFLYGAQPPARRLLLHRRPSEVYFPTTLIDDDDDATDTPPPQQQQHIYKSTPAPAVTSLFKCNALNGFSGYELDIPLFHFCLEVPSISAKRRSLSNTYRFYSEVICQQNQEENDATKELQISDADYVARNEAYLIIATHPTLPLYITANTKADAKHNKKNKKKTPKCY